MKVILTGDSVFTDDAQTALTNLGHEVLRTGVEQAVDQGTCGMPVLYLSGKSVDPFLTDAAYRDALIKKKEKR
ncbi:MAG: hypothetical protein LUD01_07890 [Clostridiales bacterium]|nr:hypothetical protein [Clostridiales bacterium]